MTPALILHADWSTEPRKRWMARATRQPNGRYHAGAAQPVGDVTTLLQRVRQMTAASGGALFGFDFPIGLPLAYARRAGIADLRTFLTQVGEGRWRDFFAVATRREEIALERPFYPQRPGNTQQAHLIEALGVETLDDLRRRCERAHAGRRAACPLFWTLGGQQVGKGAIRGWRELIAPALRAAASDVALWPFDGELDALLRDGRIVLAETYPAECYTHLGVRFPASRAGQRSGKRVQADRTAAAGPLLAWARQSGVEVGDALGAQLRDGFGLGKDGEDAFDAVVGLFGMLNVVLGQRAAGAPSDQATRRLEGWILGQAAPAER